MIEYHYENDFLLRGHQNYTDWIIRVAESEGAIINKLNYIFCDDPYLAEINLQYLNHNSFTDIITFDYSEGSEVTGDIFISTERVLDNSKLYNVDFDNELKRVMIHGILHLLGHGDKTDEEKQRMRSKENKLIEMFHVEQ